MSYGLEACSGSSFLLDKVLAHVKAPTPRFVKTASEPPAITISASSNWIERKASPIQWALVAQAVVTHLLTPFAPWRIEILPAAMLLINIGTVKGEHLVGPLWIMFWCCVSKVWKPPAPEPKTTPTLYGSSFSMSNPLSLTASSAATTPNWVNLSMRLNSFASIKLFCATSSSKVVASAPKVTKCPSRGILVKLRTPDFPSFKEFQNLSTPQPYELTMPMPVTTTRLFSMFTSILVFKKDCMGKPAVF